MRGSNACVDFPIFDAKTRSLKKAFLGAAGGAIGRNSDNTLIQRVFGWEPSISLRSGLEKTYAWILDQMKSGKSKDSVVNRS